MATSDAPAYQKAANNATGIDRPRLEGKAAAARGEPRESCPYKETTNPLGDFEMWQIGYDSVPRR